MPARKVRKKGAGPATPAKRRARPVADLLPELLAKALARRDDFIMTCEEDPGTGEKTLHVMSGRFVTPCMLRKLTGQAISQQDEGGILISRTWQ